MQQQRLEVQVLDIVERVLAGKRVEDDRVELKREWPKGFRKVARRIAGHANASAGEPILWIIGLDDESHRVHELGEEVDTADWWSQVSSNFSELAPDPQFLRVSTSDGMVMALRMDTSRTPYIVTTDGHGGVEREVPWRSGTAVRSARRSEILRSVVREAEAPQLDPISGWLRATRMFATPADPDMSREATVDRIEITYSVRAYVEAQEAVRFPEHRWALEISVGGGRYSLARTRIIGPQEVVGHSHMSPIHGPAGSILYVPSSGLHVNGSDAITINGGLTVVEGYGGLEGVLKRAQRVDIHGRFPIASSTRQAGFDAALRRSKRLALRASTHWMSIDDRLGEFTFGGAEPSWYHAERRVRTDATGD